MQLDSADGMTYWQFVRERIGAIRELPAKCQQLHFTSFAIAVPLYPALYTLVGLYPDSYIARHTQPDPSIPKGIDWSDVPDTWWSLVEGDNASTRFLAYLITALQTVAANIGEGLLGLLQSPQPPPTESILTALLNEITRIPNNIIYTCLAMP